MNHFIHGEWKEGSGDRFTSTEPASGEIEWEGRAATAEDVREAVESARHAFPDWATRSLVERTDYLHGYERILQSRRDDVADAICRDTGKPLWEARTEVEAMVAKVGISIEAYLDRCDPIIVEMETSLGVTRFRPHGAVAVFGPFNLPGHLPNGHIVPAILAGNTVVFKPSEQAPLTGRLIAEMWREAGLPDGVLNVVQGGKETGIALGDPTLVDGLFFTGSAAAGTALHRAFGGYPGKIQALEMGGNNPLVIWDVHDKEAAAILTVLSAFITAGQRCTCARRLIISSGEEGDELLDTLTEAVGRIRVGAYDADPQPFMGPVISEDAAHDVIQAQSQLSDQGATILIPVQQPDSSPCLLSPGLIDVTSVESREDREVFGPMLQVIRVDDFAAALDEADRTAFGLAAGLISDRRAWYERFLSSVRAGIINWNRQTTGASSRMPFGGVDASGNLRPSAYFAADYCSYPTASIEAETVKRPEKLPPGLD